MSFTTDWPLHDPAEYVASGHLLVSQPGLLQGQLLVHGGVQLGGHCALASGAPSCVASLRSPNLTVIPAGVILSPWLDAFPGSG